MSAGEGPKGFEAFDRELYEEEARERWGHTDAYREAARRAARYTDADWKRFAAEQDALLWEMASLMRDGVAPDDPRALDVAERMRQLVDAWFYPCSHEMHRRLGEMYVADARFAATYERVETGMAAYVRDAIVANANRHGAKGSE